MKRKVASLLGLVVALVSVAWIMGKSARLADTHAGSELKSGVQVSALRTAGALDEGSRVEPGPPDRLFDSVAARDPIVESIPFCGVLVSLCRIDRGAEIDPRGIEVAYRMGEGEARPVSVYPCLAGFVPTAVDGSGTVRVAAPEGASVEVAASGNGLFGLDSFVARNKVKIEQLLLLEDSEVLVHVSHADGSSAEGVLVVLSSLGADRPFVTQNTGVSGDSRFEHAGWLFRHGGEDPLRFAIDLPLGADLSRDLAFPAGRSEPVEMDFLLPPLGSIAVDLSAEGGTASGLVSLTLSHSGPRRGSRTLRATGSADAALVFDGVGVGQEFELTARTGIADLAQKHVKGPARDGECVHVSMSLALARFRLRAVGPDGAVLSSKPIVIWTDSARHHETSTDEGGFLEIALPPRSAPDESPTPLQLFAKQGTLGARLEVSGESGLSDLGDVRFAAFPVLARGRAVDHKGGVEGASIVCSCTSGNSAWYAFRQRVKTDADGAFELRGSSDITAVRLEAESSGAKSAPVVAPAGTEGLVLTLEEVAGIVGRLTCEQAFVLRKVEIVLKGGSGSSTASASKTELARTRAAADGSFGFEKLCAGTYAVAFEMSELGTLLEIGDIVVSCGETRRDPRLQAVKLPVQGCRLLLDCGESSTRLRGNLNHRCAGRAEAEGQWMILPGGIVDLVTRCDRLDVDLLASGYRVVSLRNVIGEVQVPLEPSPRVKLLLPDGIVLPDPPLYVKAGLATVGDGFGLDFTSKAFDGSHSLSILAPGTGPCEVVWTFEQRTSSRTRAESMKLGAGQVVNVRESAGEQEVRLVVSQADLDQALERVR